MGFCHFCGEPILGDLVVHSLDGDHDNWDPANKVDAHRSCHSGYHASLQERRPWTGTTRRVRIDEALLIPIRRALEDGESSSVQAFILDAIGQLLDTF